MSHYFQAYDPSTSTHAVVHNQVPKMYQNPNAILTSSSSSSLWPNNSLAALQQSSMPYLCNSSQQVPNNLMWQQLPPPSNNISHANGFGMFVNNTVLPLQQTSMPVSENSSASVNQLNCGRFGINSLFNSNLNADFRKTLGGSFSLGSSSHQIPMTQPVPMSSLHASGSLRGVLPFGAADIGNSTNANTPMSSLPIDALGSLRGVSPFCAADVGNSTNANTPMSSLPIDASSSLRGVSPFFAAAIGNSTNANTTRVVEEPNSIHGSTKDHQIPMAQPLPMSSLPIDASSSLRAAVGGDDDTNANTTRASEEAELTDIFGSLEDFLLN
ncbi:hypothetical protein L195_g020514 [Trifolium pratense]|uniref:Uncharacterized protein n=1 Tax=Trifolium pratense TaxID=57577 RepID=A0A2K3KZ24_TRIPR|nr:hypothetical protein L195_g027414 [Trifolium pratense]PNX87494.1 hypothetical protein L195_g043583 [Trifolium pratense]PNX97288.1 hypothetical protein L195_g020514 [Trifolium pratense]